MKRSHVLIAALACPYILGLASLARLDIIEAYEVRADQIVLLNAEGQPARIIKLDQNGDVVVMLYGDQHVTHTVKITEPELNEPATQPATQRINDPVYVTPHGKKYHASTCRYAKNGEPATRQQARSKGLEPCKVCTPNRST